MTTMIKNTQGISSITMKPKAVCYCPLGSDWYTNEFEIDMIPDEYYPDYCHVEKYLDENIRGKTLIIEDAVFGVYYFIKETYNPRQLTVTSYVNDVTSHSPVVVTKE